MIANAQFASMGMQSILLILIYCIPEEDSFFKEREGKSLASKWGMNVGWR